MKRTDTTQFAGAEQAPRSQFGALCWRMHRGQAQVLLITSRDTGRWIIPKGWPMDGIAAHDAAAVEAYEEAGVRGSVASDPVGFFNYDKVLSPTHALPCGVACFPLHVEKLCAKFPERKERRRKWFAAAKAARKVAEPELRALFQSLAEDPSPLMAAQRPG